ncbi:hypothetical protein UFOVP208_35 [uncultured Caudovirales phage]|uniref:Uncharacterized protein n=1 Tax=uncultured Caudovirales phage TaxID=2100421 RepID=A0A6J7WPE1_9CAUD|nr:hypothetical protein UFOVP208_35 [uncultured Caudovirales phage]
MTLVQVVQRLEALALSHKQINHVFYGEVVEWLSNGEIRYPACCFDINNSVMSKEDRQIKFTFEVWFLDLVDIDILANGNQLDVMSDLTQIAGDFMAMLNFYDYQDDFTIVPSYNLEFYREKFEDLTIAVKTTVTIGIDYLSDRCAVPASGVQFEPAQPYSPSIRISDGTCYNYIYTATGSEGTAVTFASLVNKEILLVFLGDKKLTPSATPSVNEFNYNNITGTFTFGIELQEEQKVQIIYRSIII